MSAAQFPLNPIIDDAEDVGDPAVMEYNNTLYVYPSYTERLNELIVYSRPVNAPASTPFKRHHSPILQPPHMNCVERLIENHSIAEKLNPILGLIPPDIIYSIVRASMWLSNMWPSLANMDQLVWAPHVFYNNDAQPGEKKFYLYYSQCMQINVAWSDSPVGPFEQAADPRLVPVMGIDPFVWRDPKSGKLFLYHGRVFHNLHGQVSEPPYAEEINGLEMESPTKLKGLTGTSSEAEYNRVTTRIIHPNKKWEFDAPPAGLMSFAGIDLYNGVNEAPWMQYVDGRYVLGYSGAAVTANYNLGVATGDDPLGPFVKSSTNPIINSDHGLFHHTGHHSVWTDRSGKMWAFYHSNKTAYSGGRVIFVDEWKPVCPATPPKPDYSRLVVQAEYGWWGMPGWATPILVDATPQMCGVFDGSDLTVSDIGQFLAQRGVRDPAPFMRKAIKFTFADGHTQRFDEFTTFTLVSPTCHDNVCSVDKIRPWARRDESQTHLHANVNADLYRTSFPLPFCGLPALWVVMMLLLLVFNKCKRLSQTRTGK